MFLRFIISALKYRRRRLLLAFAAMTVGAALSTVLFGIYGSAEGRIRNAFRTYGANLTAVPASGNLISLGLAESAEQLGAEAAPFLITTGEIGGQAVPIAGFIPAKTAGMTSYWHIKGSRDIGTDECLAGESVASGLKAVIGSQLPLAKAPCTLKGIVSTGGAEDRELLVPFETASRLAGIQDQASVIQIRAPGDRVESIRATLSQQFPGAEVRTIRSVVETESTVALKIRGSLLLLTLIILATTTLCVSGNFSEMVIERAKEIAILKAIGGAERKIAAFFLSESTALGLLAAIAGYLGGIFITAEITRDIFGGIFAPQGSWLVFAGVTGIMLAVSAVATAIATSRIWSIQPAVVLRGD